MQLCTLTFLFSNFTLLWFAQSLTWYKEHSFIIWFHHKTAHFELFVMVKLKELQQLKYILHRDILFVSQTATDPVHLNTLELTDILQYYRHLHHHVEPCWHAHFQISTDFSFQFVHVSFLFLKSGFKHSECATAPRGGSVARRQPTTRCRAGQTTAQRQTAK